MGVAETELMACQQHSNSDGMPVDFCRSAECIRFACDHGATILNCSFGGGADPEVAEGIPALTDLQILKSLIYARKKNAIVVTSAGNSRRNNDNIIHYPSGFANIDLHELADKLTNAGSNPAIFGLNAKNLIDDNGEPFDTLDNIVVVAATAENGELADFSNFGTTTVHLAAPGENIYSAVPSDLFIDNRTYDSKSGTSMAVAHVTGSLGIMRQLFSTLPSVDLIARIMSATDEIVNQDPANPLLMSGRVNLDKALSRVLTHP